MLYFLFSRKSGFIKTFILVVIFYALVPYSFGLYRVPPQIDRSRLSGITDDSPLARSSDKASWDYLFGILRRYSEEALEEMDAIPAGFLELNRQPVEYRGRIVKITGKLLRCEFVPVKPDESPFETGETAEQTQKTGFYQSWIVLPDRKEIPVCVCSLEIPDRINSNGDDISFPVSVTGIYYKRMLYLSDKDEEVHTPVILAKTLKLLPVSKQEKTENQKTAVKKYNWNAYFFSTVGLLIALWLLLRTRSKNNKWKIQSTAKYEPRQTDSGNEENREENRTVTLNSDETLNLPSSKSNFCMILILVLSGICGTFSPLCSAEEDAVLAGKIDAEFTRTQLLQTDEYTWDALGDEKVPLEQQRDSVLNLMERLRRYVPASFLKENIAAAFPKRLENPFPLPVLTEDPAQYRGKVFRLTGTLVSAEIIPLNPAEQKAMEIPAVCRCRIEVADTANNSSAGKHTAEVWTAFAPSSLCKKEQVKDIPSKNTKESVAITGIYIKRIHSNGKNDAPLIPLLVSSRLEWYPDNYLGSLGMDFGLFEQVPVLKISDLKKKEIEIPASLTLLPRRELIRLAFKFTSADKEPFYGILRAAAKTPPGRIEQEARKELQKESGPQKKNRTSAVMLFNNPAEMRGKPVLLTGTARRVLPVLVEDEEVKKLYGIDKYYQIYLFTEDSQNNPLVICTALLPEGMPTGSAPDYNEIITVGAFPYKLWVYESSEKLEADEKHPDSYKPSFAPMLIGRCPLWHSNPKDAAKPVKKPLGIDLPEEVQTGFTIVLFVALFGIWIFIRRLKTGRKIEFKLRK